ARGGTAEAVLLARTGRAARADDLRLTRRALGDPADVEDLAHGLELAARAARDRGAPAAAAAARLDLVDDLARVDPLGRERRREIDARAHDVRVPGRIAAAHRLAAVESGVVAVAQDRDLRGGTRRARVQHAEYRPVAAR